MKKLTIAYWVTTIVFCAIFVLGGVANVVRADAQREVMTQLGYPMYLLTLLGVAKILGVIALLVPRFPRLKEWAYAGFTFDMIGASYSHAAVGDPISNTLAPLVILLVGMVSYSTRPSARRI